MKKLLVTSIATLLSFIGPIGQTAISFAEERPNEIEFSDKIKPLSHNNTTINILNGNLQEFWSITDLYSNTASRVNQVDELYTYNSELATFSNSGIWNVNANLWKIFDKYDSFKPVNNIISWKSSLDNVKEYHVSLSRDKDFKTVDHYLSTDGNNNSVKVNNLLTGVTYYWQVNAELNNGSSIYSDIFTFDVMDTTRVLNIYGVDNTRDWGGYTNSNGVRTKQGLVFRGARLDNISNEGKEECRTLGIKTDLDLRSAGEGAANPCNFDHYYNYSCPYYYGGSTGLDVTSFQPAFGNAVKTFANKDNYPIFFHCSVGRDRTGTLSAMLNILCEVDREIIMREYVQSVFSVTGAWTKGSENMFNNLKSIFNYLNTFSGSTMKEKAITYLTTKCGVTVDEINQVVDILTGKEEMNDYLSRDNTLNYDGYSRVELLRTGARVAKMVKNGEKLLNPTPELDGNWYNKEAIWDFENDIVDEDVVLVYKEARKAKITLNFVGVTRSSEVIDIKVGETLDLSTYNIEGKTLVAIDDTFKEVNEYVVTRDATLNLIYQ